MLYPLSRSASPWSEAFRLGPPCHTCVDCRSGAASWARPTCPSSARQRGHRACAVLAAGGGIGPASTFSLAHPGDGAPVLGCSGHAAFRFPLARCPCLGPVRLHFLHVTAFYGTAFHRAAMQASPVIHARAAASGKPPRWSGVSTRAGSAARNATSCAQNPSRAGLSAKFGPATVCAETS